MKNNGNIADIYSLVKQYEAKNYKLTTYLHKYNHMCEEAEFEKVETEKEVSKSI